jgi:D-inositol-3-phosphate glycosyltransferase
MLTTIPSTTMSSSSAASSSAQAMLAQSAPPTVKSKYPRRQAIALISVHGDPAADIGQEEAGGQNVYVRHVGENLAKLGWQVDMFTRKRHPNDATIVNHTPYCRTIRLEAGEPGLIPRDQLLPHLDEFIDNFFAFQAKQGAHYPLVHTNYWLSGLVGMRIKKKQAIQQVHTYHSLGAVKYQAMGALNPMAQKRLQVEQLLLEQADRIIATSPQEQEHMRTLVSELGNIDIIPCGTDTQAFRRISRADARQQLGIPLHQPMVLYVGRFDPRKGIETAIRAMLNLSPAPSDPAPNLYIVGGSDPKQADGLERQRIEALVQELGIQETTHFVGRVGHDRLPLYYTAADVCVIPSHYEPFGLVAIEAMACGTPVVASDVGGLKFSIVPEETGLLVPPQDIAAFTAAIDRVLQDDLWAQKARRQAVLRVQQNFSWAGVAGQLSDLYRRLMVQSLTAAPIGVATGMSTLVRAS